MDPYSGGFSKSTEQYFASLPADQTAGILLDRARSFYSVLTANSYLEKLSNMWRAYHGAYGDYVGFGHKIDFTGEQGELVHLAVNHFRNIAQHMLNMIVANRPIMECRAMNTDYKSLAQTYLGNGILEYYMREKRLEDSLKRAVEYAIVLGAGYIKVAWNATAGEAYDYDEETGEFNYEGDLEFTNYSPFDVVVDGTKETYNPDWVLVRSYKNRYDLMAQYPEMADRIKATPTKTDSTIYRLAVFSNDQTDDVPVYEFFHKRTEAIPEGRYMLFLEPNITLLDTKLPYRVIPIFRIAAGEILGTPYAYTPMFDLFPLQEAINASYSAIMTNQNAFAVQNLWVPRGADISVNTLVGAMNIIEGNAKPESLQLTETPQEVFKYLEMLIQAMETISGVNSVSRGNPEASLKSGTALALVQSMALQFMSGLQQNYVKLIEDVGTSLIEILKDFSVTPRVIAIVGKNNRTYLKEFTGDKINAINRVIVDMGNPLGRTIAGRVQIAEQLLQMKLLRSPEQYFQVMNTGRLDNAFESDMVQLLLVQQENEKLRSGETVKALILDHHKLHISEHSSVLGDPELRKDTVLVQNTLNHIQEHIDLLRSGDPDLLTLLGEQPLHPQGQMPDGGGMPPGPDGQQPPQSSLNGATPQVMTGQQAPSIQGPGGNTPLPNLPQPPAPFQNLPVTAEQAAGNK